jgi:hypothetical protein
LVAVLEIEAAGVRGEVEGEARGGDVERSEHGVVAGPLPVVEGRRRRGFDGVEEVAEEGRGAREAAGGDAAPSVASKGSAEEIDEGETAEDVGEDIHGEDVYRSVLLRLHRGWWRKRGEQARGRWSFGLELGLGLGLASASLLPSLPCHCRRRRRRWCWTAGEFWSLEREQVAR